MSVGEGQVAALRALLTGDFEEHSRLTQQLDNNGMHDYMTLVSAAFVDAVDRRFGGEDLPAAVIGYVGQVRSLNEHAAETIDPDIAERVILAALGHGSISDVNGRQIRHTQNLLLPLLVRDEQRDDAGIDTILASARELAQA